jgi:hypothetical protein
MSCLLFSPSPFLAAARKDDVLFSIDFSTSDFLCPYTLTVPQFHFGLKLITSRLYGTEVEAFTRR